MIEREIYNKGQLVVARVSGNVTGQEIVDHVFWLIDSHTIGEVVSGYAQLIFVEAIDSMNIKEEDIHRVMQIGTGMGQARGKFKTAIIAAEPYDMELASLYKSLAKDAELEVELCQDFAQAFEWLACENPEPDRYK